MIKNLRIWTLSLSLLASTALMLPSVALGMQNNLGNNPPQDINQGNNNPLGGQPHPHQQAADEIDALEAQITLFNLAENEYRENEVVRLGALRARRVAIREVQQATTSNFFDSLNSVRYQPDLVDGAFAPNDQPNFLSSRDAFGWVQSLRRVMYGGPVYFTIPYGFNFSINYLKNNGNKISGQVYFALPTTYLGNILNEDTIDNLLDLRNAQLIVDPRNFATNVLRILKFSNKPLVGNFEDIRRAKKISALIMTIERLRHEQSLALAYVEFYLLKHGLVTIYDIFHPFLASFIPARRALKDIINRFNINWLNTIPELHEDLVPAQYNRHNRKMVPASEKIVNYFSLLGCYFPDMEDDFCPVREGGADQIRYTASQRLVERFMLATRVYEERCRVSEKFENFRMSSNEFLIKKLSKLQFIHGFRNKGGYIYTRNLRDQLQLQYVAFGESVPNNVANVGGLGHLPASHNQVFISGEGNACLFRAVNAAMVQDDGNARTRIAQTPARLARQWATDRMRIRLAAQGNNLGEGQAVSLSLGELHLRPAEIAGWLMRDLQDYYGSLPSQRGVNLSPERQAFLAQLMGPHPALVLAGLPAALELGNHAELNNLLLQYPVEMRQVLENYIQHIQERHTFEGSEMIGVLARATGHRIEVYGRDIGQGEHLDYGDGNILRLHHTGYTGEFEGVPNHYNALVAIPQQQQVQHHGQQQQQQQLGGQGGGGQQGHAQQPLQQGQLLQNQQQQAQHQNQPPQNNQQQVSQEVAGDDSVLKTLTATLSSWRGWVRKQDWSGILKSAFLLQRSKGTF